MIMTTVDDDGDGWCRVIIIMMSVDGDGGNEFRWQMMAKIVEYDNGD